MCTIQFECIQNSTKCNFVRAFYVCFLGCCASTAFHGSMHEFACSPARKQQQSHRQPASQPSLAQWRRCYGRKTLVMMRLVVGVRISSTCLFAPLQVITMRVHAGASSPPTNNVEHRIPMISFASSFMRVPMFQTPERFRHNIATSNHRVREKWNRSEFLMLTIIYY